MKKILNLLPTHVVLSARDMDDEYGGTSALVCFAAALDVLRARSEDNRDDEAEAMAVFAGLVHESVIEMVLDRAAVFGEMFVEGA